jgi:hypothetical protein
MTCGVARIVCVPTGDGYIIASVNCEKLFKDYIRQGRAGELTTFQETFDTYGRQNFRLDILETCEPRVLEDRRQHYLDLTIGSELNTTRNRKSRPGERRKERWEWVTKSEAAKLRWLIPSMRKKMVDGMSKPRSPEGRKKIASASARFWTSPESVETREKLAKARRGTKATAEMRAILSAAKKGKSKSPEHRQKISAALKGYQKSPEHRAKLTQALRQRNAEKRSAGDVAPAAVVKPAWKPSPEHQAKLDAANQRRVQER